MGEYHVRFCERFGVKLPLPTRLIPFLLPLYLWKTKTSSIEKVLNLSGHFSGTRPLRLRQHYGTFKIKTTWRKKIQKTIQYCKSIVDFCCPSEKLIIELDGDPHGEYHKPINHPGRNQVFLYLDNNWLRPPLLQKEGKVFLTNWISTLKSVCL